MKHIQLRHLFIKELVRAHRITIDKVPGETNPADLMTKVLGGVAVDKSYCVYLLANRKHGALYLGVTSDLAGRLYQHRTKALPGFTSRYGIDRLVWVEWHTSIVAAIAREKAIKKWNRQWKIDLFAENNPDWDDLAVALFGMTPA